MIDLLGTLAATLVGGGLALTGSWWLDRRTQRDRRYERSKEAVGQVLTAWFAIEQIKVAASSSFGHTPTEKELDKLFAQLTQAVPNFQLALNMAKLSPLSPEAEQALAKAAFAAQSVHLLRNDFAELDAGREPVNEALGELTKAVQVMALEGAPEQLEKT